MHSSLLVLVIRWQCKGYMDLSFVTYDVIGCHHPSTRPFDVLNIPPLEQTDNMDFGRDGKGGVSESNDSKWRNLYTISLFDSFRYQLKAVYSHFAYFEVQLLCCSNLCDAIPLRWPTVLIIWWDVYRGTKENDFQSFTSNEISTSIRTPGPSHKALHHHMVSLTWHTSNVFCSLSLWSRIPDKRLSIPCPSVWEFDNDMRLGDDTLYVGWLWDSFCAFTAAMQVSE